MKQINKKTKIFCAILLVIIIVGIIVVALKGFNVEKKYKSNDIITIYIGEDVDIQEIKEIASEVFGNNLSSVQFVEIYDDIIQITANEITEEQKQEVVDKINELYSSDDEQAEDELIDTVEQSTDETVIDETVTNESENIIIDADDVEIISISNIRVRDLLKPYIMSLVIVTIILLVYVGIRFYKIGLLKSILQTGVVIALTQFVLVCLMAITRFPIGIFTPTVILVFYMLSVIGIIRNLEKKLK